METPTLHRQISLWTVILVLVPSLLIMGIYTVNQIRIAKQQNLELIGQRVLSQHQLIENRIADWLNNVRNLSQSESFRALDEPRMRRALEVSQRINKDFDSLSFIDKDGNFQMSTLAGGIRISAAAGQPYFQVAQAGNDYVSGVVVGRNSGIPIVNFSSPVYDYDGHFQGLVLGSVRLAMLQMLLQDSWIGETGELFIVDRDGTMITEPRYTDVLISKGLVKETAVMNFKITADAMRNIKIGESGTATWIDYKGDKVIGAYRSVPQRDWVIIGKIGESEVLASIYSQLAVMAGGILVLLCIILPFTIRATDRIKRPIDWLIVQSRLVAAEDYAAAVGTKCRDKAPHELRELCETFGAMARKIQASMGQLRENEGKLKELNAELDGKVREIQEINATLEEEIMERQATQEALRKALDEVLNGENQLKSYAAQLAAANEELAATNTELKSFANIVAHDFRSPMVNLKGFASELELSLRDLCMIIADNKALLPPDVQGRVGELLGKDVPEALKYIDSSVSRLSRMVEALLQLSRAGRRELTRQEIDMGGLVANSLQSYQKLIQANNIRIQVDALPRIETDQVAMEQIVGNLLDNAIKYLEPGRRGEIVIGCAEEADNYLFSVQDNGRGIVAEDQEKIFEVFRRAGKQDVPGDGMGLAYVRTLIRQLGGRVWCESRLGEGTKIVFTVPKKNN